MEIKLRIHQLVEGYAIINVLKLVSEEKVKFGMWNERPLRKDKAQDMLESYILNGVQNVIPENFMELVAPESSIVWENLSRDMHSGDRLPLLSFVAGIVEVLKLAGGRHRYEALILWQAMLENDSKKVEDRIKYIQEQQRSLVSTFYG
jgi:hypothetical protein